MPLQIDDPEVEERIRGLAAERNMKAEEYLMELVSAHLPPRLTAQARKVTTAERKAALDRFAQRIPLDTPLLSDEAFSREHLYDERG